MVSKESCVDGRELKRIKEIVEKELSCSAHDMEHVLRVYSLSLKLAENKNVDLSILKAASLLHDVACIREDHDNTGSIDHAILGAEMAEKILKELNYSAQGKPTTV